MLDDLDRKIIQSLSNGINSYEELSRNCNVTRNTIYRRIAFLENKGIIKNTTSCVVNLEKLDLTPVCIGACVPENEKDRAFSLVAVNRKVRFLWRTFGDHNMMLVAFCDKGEEGALIQNITATLEGCNASKVEVSTGFVWEKMNFLPFDEQTEIERIAQVIEKRH